MADRIQLKDRGSVKVKEPKKYKVIMHNDDFTSMDFVVSILIEIFKKNQNEAVHLMMMVHQKGMEVVGIYSYDIAKSKIDLAQDFARNEGFPFRLTLQED